MAASCPERAPKGGSIARWALQVAALLALPGAPLGAQESLPYAEVGLGRKQGDFGTQTQSTLWLGFATYGVATDRWDASATVPYLDVKSEGGGVSTQARGVGDVLARAIYRVLPENLDGWSLDLGGALKLPTANEAKGLGTGRTDLGGFMSLHQRVEMFQWTLLAGWVQSDSMGSTGSVSGLNSGAYVAGLGGALIHEQTRWGLSLEARGPVYTGTPGARDVSADVFHLFSPRWGMRAVATLGLSDGSPRQSFGLSVVRLFPN